MCICVYPINFASVIRKIIYMYEKCGSLFSFFTDLSTHISHPLYSCNSWNDCAFCHGTMIILHFFKTSFLYTIIAWCAANEIQHYMYIVSLWNQLQYTDRNDAIMTIYNISSSHKSSKTNKSKSTYPPLNLSTQNTHSVIFMITHYQYFICQSLIFHILKLPIHIIKSSK